MKHIKYIALMILVVAGYSVPMLGYYYNNNRHYYKYHSPNQRYDYRYGYKRYHEPYNNVYNYRTTEIHSAVKQKNILAVKRYIRYGIDVNSVDHNGDTALHLAVERGYYDIAKLLLQNEAKVDIKNDYGETCIFYLIAYPNKETQIMNMLNLLTHYKSNIYEEDDKGNTLMDKLREKKYNSLADKIESKFGKK